MMSNRREIGVPRGGKFQSRNLKADKHAVSRVPTVAADADSPAGSNSVAVEIPEGENLAKGRKVSNTPRLSKTQKRGGNVDHSAGPQNGLAGKGVKPGPVISGRRPYDPHHTVAANHHRKIIGESNSGVKRTQAYVDRFNIWVFDQRDILYPMVCVFCHNVSKFLCDCTVEEGWEDEVPASVQAQPASAPVATQGVVGFIPEGLEGCGSSSSGFFDFSGFQPQLYEHNVHGRVIKTEFPYLREVDIPVVVNAVDVGEDIAKRLAAIQPCNDPLPVKVEPIAKADRFEPDRMLVVQRKAKWYNRILGKQPSRMDYSNDHNYHIDRLFAHKAKTGQFPVVPDILVIPELYRYLRFEMHVEYANLKVAFEHNHKLAKKWCDITKYQPTASAEALNRLQATICKAVCCQDNAYNYAPTSGALSRWPGKSGRTTVF